ncbi:MAG: hypothetical protein RJB13_714 [Pseudomonadota bacterium]
MPVSSPKNSRDKRLHLVFFTDASKSKSTSISVRNLVVVVLGIVSLLSASGLSIYLYNKNRTLLSQKDEYIRELKATITALSIASDDGQLLQNDGTNTPERLLAEKIADEIRNFTDTESIVSASATDNTLANLQSSSSSLSSVSANLGRDGKKIGTPPIQFAAKPVAPNNNMKNDNSVAQKPRNNKAPAPLTGVEVEQGHTTELNGQTTIHFQLVNTLNNGQARIGRVCGIAEIAEENKVQRGFSRNMVAIPSGRPVASSVTPSNSCADGELVRFSRLRPTELVIPAKQDSIKGVTIFFVESGSKKTLKQRFEF